MASWRQARPYTNGTFPERRSPIPIPSAIQQLEDEYNELLGELGEAEERFGQIRALIEAPFSDIAVGKKTRHPTDAEVVEYNSASDAILEIHRKMRDVIGRLKKLP